MHPCSVHIVKVSWDCSVVRVATTGRRAVPVRDLEAVFYVTRVPEIAFRDGAFHIAYEVGKCRFEFAMPPNVFLKARRCADRSIDQFNAHGDVVDIPKRERGH
jgi:hypothetical protein